MNWDNSKFMKIAVSGYRDFNDYSYFSKKLLKLNIGEILVGDSRGVDTMAQKYCMENVIPYKIFVAEWKKYGKAAGPIRNRKILDEKPDLVILFLHPLSKGTKDMFNAVKEKNIPYVVYHI